MNNKANSHKWEQTEDSTLKCRNCGDINEYTGASFDPFEGECLPDPKKDGIKQA